MAIRADSSPVILFAAYQLLLVEQVKGARRRGVTRISRKYQVALPVEALRRAGLNVGDELRVEAAGAGRLVLVRTVDLVKRYAGSLAGVYQQSYLADLRNEWR